MEEQPRHQEFWPETQWGRLDTPLSRAAIAIGCTRAGAWVLRRCVGLDRQILLRTQGKRTVFGPIGMPLLLLVTTGRKSGRTVITPLCYVRDHERILVAGSNFGQVQEPHWTANLRARPKAQVIMAGRSISVYATELTGDEKARLYGRFIDTLRVFAVYRDRSRREIPMFSLEAR
ncbi:nitroreductase/quinone reductase family protein [Nocardia terpenica]|uniref:Nitroreductase family deazaflavin-dependent oxidoreductase n=1 Tax=Nocardia terpenica TaxID=455432 RepID=A0A6G9YUF0_9NOCA|nr:nitroreductase/quinone reductase family protein [Nocardia terpenica]QIS16955.1 nitroreductase family deazaflavin-dependent oxidoreductase [Nocardia terpenica]